MRLLIDELGQRIDASRLDRRLGCLALDATPRSLRVLQHPEQDRVADVLCCPIPRHDHDVVSIRPRFASRIPDCDTGGDGWYVIPGPGRPVVI